MNCHFEYAQSFFIFIQKHPKVKITPFLLPLKTLALLDRFKSKLSSVISESPSVPEEDVEELGEDDDKGWWVAFTRFSIPTVV